jgi:hypothetical protein
LKKLSYKDVGYHGKPIDALSHEELLAAFLELAQAVNDCSSKDNTCKEIFRTQN